jgi:hypothetical protein
MRRDDIERLRQLARTSERSLSAEIRFAVNSHLAGAEAARRGLRLLIRNATLEG